MTPEQRRWLESLADELEKYGRVVSFGALRALLAERDALAAEVERLREELHTANRKANAAQTLNSNQRQMVDAAEIEKGVLLAAIRKHMNIRGDDRNGADNELYGVLQ